MIDLINRDRKIYDIEYRIVDIIHEYQTNGEVHITTNGEGISLDKVKFFNLLDYVCEKFNIEKNKVYIHTFNILEKHPEYNIEANLSHWWYSIQAHIDKFYVFKEKKKELKTICSFMGRVNWCRLIFASWLAQNKSLNVSLPLIAVNSRGVINSAPPLVKIGVM